jgi:cell division protein FtsQ
MPEPAANPAKYSSVHYVVMGVLMVLVLAGLIGAQIWKRDLKVAGVRTEGNRILSSADVQRLANVPVGVRLFDLDLATIEKRVEKNPFVREAAVQRDLPDRIAIKIEERVPIAALSGSRLLYLDADGVILPSVRSENVFDLPVITGAVQEQDRLPGRKVTGKSLQDAVQLLRAALELDENLYRRISEVSIRDNGDLVAYTVDFGVPVIFGRGDLAMKLATLESFWNSVVNGRGANELASIDVRFTDQVVVRWTVDN